LAADARGTCDIGRRARLELVFGVRGGRTVLLHAYAEPPLRVGKVFDTVVDDGPGVHLILASSSPGIFGGDGFEQTVVVKAGARVRLTSQSALQVHPTNGHAAATIASAYRIEPAGHLRAEWDPVIPFGGARLAQSIEISLADGATLFWSDALMAGRERRGERWQFERVAHELKLLRSGHLSYLERYRIAPRSQSVEQTWIADDANYFGTILAVRPGLDRDAAEAIHRSLNTEESVRGAADLLEPDLLIARLMSYSGAAFRKARLSVASH